MFVIINKRSGLIVSEAKTKAGARKAKDRRDIAYGAYVHSIREVMPDGSYSFTI